LLRRFYWEAFVKSKKGLGEEKKFDMKHIPHLPENAKNEEAD
jgi:hypothetical protein